MKRLTHTKEKRERDNLGALKYLSPEMCAKWDERLTAYEDTGMTPAEIVAMRKELEARKANWEEEASDGTGYTLTHVAGSYAVADEDGHVLCEFLRDPCVLSPCEGEGATEGDGEG